MTSPCPSTPSLQADLVGIVAGSLPRGAVVDQQLLEQLMHCIRAQGCLGNEHKARARAAVLGALSRGLRVRQAHRSAVDVFVTKLLCVADDTAGVPALCMAKGDLLLETAKERCESPSGGVLPRLSVWTTVNSKSVRHPSLPT